MTKNIILIHDKALKTDYLSNIDKNEKAIFIWDDNYFKQRQYSLKRLIFIYETLCEMKIDIIKGDVLQVIDSLKPDKVKTYFTADTAIRQITQNIANNYDVEIIKPQDFVKISDGFKFTRFFKYWNKAKKTAFLENGNQ